MAFVCSRSKERGRSSIVDIDFSAREDRDQGSALVWDQRRDIKILLIQRSTWYDITDMVSLTWYHWYRDQRYWYEISWYQCAYEGSRSRISADLGSTTWYQECFDTEVDVIRYHWYDITDVISLIWYHWYRDQWYWYEISWYQRAYEGSRSRISAEVGDQGDLVVWLDIKSGSKMSNIRYEIEYDIEIDVILISMDDVISTYDLKLNSVTWRLPMTNQRIKSSPAYT